MIPSASARSASNETTTAFAALASASAFSRPLISALSHRLPAAIRSFKSAISASLIARPPVNSRRVAFRLASSPRGAGEASHSTGETHHRNGDIRLSDEFANRPANDSLYIGNSRSSRGPLDIFIPSADSYRGLSEFIAHL